MDLPRRVRRTLSFIPHHRRRNPFSQSDRPLGGAWPWPWRNDPRRARLEDRLDGAPFASFGGCRWGRASDRPHQAIEQPLETGGGWGSERQRVERASWPADELSYRASRRESQGGP